MSRKVQMKNGRHKRFAANERKTSLEALINEESPKAARTHDQAMEQVNRAPSVIARLMGLDKLPGDVNNPRQSSTECMVDHTGICLSAPKCNRERQHHEDRLHKRFQKMEKESMNQLNDSKDEKITLHFWENTKNQHLQGCESSPPSHPKFLDAECSGSKEVLDDIKFLQSNNEIPTRVLQGTKFSSFDKHMQRNDINSCFSSRSCMDNGRNFARRERRRDSFGRSRVLNFGGIESSPRLDHDGDYLINSGKNLQYCVNFDTTTCGEYELDSEILQSDIDFKISSRAVYLTNVEKNLENFQSSIPSRIVVLKPSRSRVRNAKPNLVQLKNDYKEFREGDENADHYFDRKLLNNSTAEPSKYDGSMVPDLCNHNNTLKFPRKIVKDTTRHVGEACTRHDDMCLNTMDLDLDLLKSVSNFKKLSNNKIEKNVIIGGDLGSGEAKAKQQFMITILRPTELVRRPSSGWGKATKKFERTLFDADKLVTNDTSQCNIDFDSSELDIPNIDSCIESQNHPVCGSQNQSNSVPWCNSMNDKSRQNVNVDNEKDPSERSPVSVLKEHFLEEEFIEIKGKCLDQDSDLPLQLCQEEGEAVQRSLPEHFVGDPSFNHIDSSTDAKAFDHMTSSEMLYVKDVLLASGLMRDDDLLHHIHSLSQPLNPSLFKELDLSYLSKPREWGTLHPSSQRQLLFDALNEILSDLLGFPLHCCGKTFANQHMLPSRERLVKYVLSIFASPLETIENLVAKHVMRDKWLHPNVGMEALGNHIERCILDDLIEETTILLFPSEQMYGLYVYPRFS